MDSNFTQISTAWPNTTMAPDGNESDAIFEHSYTRIQIDKICTPFMYIIGFPGNTLSLIVWLQKRMRHSSGYYLAALALNDLLFLSLQVLYELEQVWGKPILAHPGVCQIFPTLFLTTQCMSPILVLAFTTERFISICYPFRRDTFCTVKRAKIVILSLAVTALAINCANSVFFELNGNICGPPKKLVSIFLVYSTCVESLFYFFVPLAILCLNIKVILEMRRLSRMEQALQHTDGQKTGSTTVMLLAVSFYQILTTLPISIITVWVITGEQNDTFQLVRTIIYEYGYTHYAFNIFIYLVTGKMFRQELKKLLLRPVHKLFYEDNGFGSEYSTLRTSVFTTSPGKKSTMISKTNGSVKQPTKNGDPSETLL